EAPRAARDLLAALAGVRGLRAATGLWAAADLPLERAWTDGVAPDALGTLTGDRDRDRTMLDAWAAEGTGGLVERMPAALPEGPDAARLVLASALALRLKWLRPFGQTAREVDDGPWAGRSLLMLYRSTSLPDRVRVAHGPGGPVTLFEVVGDTGVDVHLVLGEPDAAPGEVLGTGIEAATRARPSTGASLLPLGNPGPGLSVTMVPALSPAPRLDVETPAFEIRAEHDLLDHARLFGLGAACDNGSGHFPGISPEPLAVGSARQSALARFHATGFEAAAVTAIGLSVGSPPRFPYRVRRAALAFHRPFGFLAVHRTSRLVLSAGWVTEPVPYLPPAEEEWEDGEEEEWAPAAARPARPSR
ncbi:serpin family protein, partial [Streptomyces sp. NPDC031705]|uniref:serpin family protein n=1 Tax=Streptomyces sp. NPDC031705 TaxID=3155729 RepID=UPI0033F55EED